MAIETDTPVRLDARRERIVDAIAPATLEDNALAFSPGEVLLETLWPDEATRPTMRWLRKMTATRALPYVRLGNRVWFDIPAVRQHLAKRYTVEAFSL